MLSRFAKILTRHPTVVALLAVLLLIPCAFGYFKTGVNYDILSYLPKNLDSVKGEDVLEDTFHDAATSMLVIEGMPEKDIADLKDKIKNVPGVNDCVWIDDIADLSVPRDMLPDKVKDLFYSDRSTMMLITYNGSTSSEETFDAIANIKKLLNKQCYLSGFSAMQRDMKNLLLGEMPFYILLAGGLCLVVMLFCMESWVLPFVFLGGIGIAIIYNMGTNVFLGEISYITQAIAAVLQLAVTMDYSIFLINRYDEETPKFEDRRDAMASAIQSTFLSLAGSSLTTVAGFLALCFMELTIGKDIGIVMMKGVILGVLSTVTVLPSLILLFDKPIHKYRHRPLIPKFDRGADFLIRHRRVMILLLLLLIGPSFYMQSHAAVYYNLDKTLPATLDSRVATDKLKKEFDMATTHFVILDNNLPSYKMKDMIGQIKDLDGVKNVLGYDDLIGPAVPDDFIPQKVKELCKKDGKQIIMINSRYAAADNSENAQIDRITKITKQFDPSSQVTGEGALTKDLVEIADHDFTVTGYISAVLMLVIIALVFKSAAVPFILVSVIELAIYINLGVPFLTGETIPFISPIVINCVQMGATVDYSILMTTRFQEELKAGKSRMEAVRAASVTSFPSIITSSLVFFCATTGVSWISQMGIISSICAMLARGAIVSAVIIITLLPAVLYVTEPFLRKLSYHFDTN
ncbi:antibiotic ABC transporter permease [Caproiciproducens sp. NJN-50]|uniref:efflux RND transporter permease subunit n=1 Tax=Acutalibacteraceae TaxID=3082771 RepID=UPI000FFDFC9B|nr:MULTISPECIES: MMPL family transporter [Acutalibacteraceae]QAT50769.1 antibiotic ABC transporter permease [Caproiciproducens sp. NJN-50]